VINECSHIRSQELMTTLLHLQKCMKCGYIREYNPNKKKNMTIMTPDLWSDWSVSTKEIDSLFVINKN
jgi:hypothetical protein